MKSKFLKIAGVNSEQEFYNRYPTEESFFQDYPEARQMAKGGEMIRRQDGSYSKRGLWDNIRANRGSGKKPTKEMLEQERKIKAKEMKYGGTNNPGFEALPEYVQAKILANMGYGGMTHPFMAEGGPTIPFSNEFYNNLEKEYHDFYNIQPPMRPHNDDGFDNFYHKKVSPLPKVQYDSGSGWVSIDDDDHSVTFKKAERGKPMSKMFKELPGRKEFVDSYMESADNPLTFHYNEMISNIAKDRFRSKAPIQRAMKMQQGGEPDGAMALGQIDAAMDKLMNLRKFIQPDSDLEPWVSSKLTMLDHYTDAVSDYMQYNPEAQGGMMMDDSEGLPMEQMKEGGIPQRYKNMGFNKVGAKKKSTRPGKKWMVLAKKGDDYKVVHGGYKGMQDYTQHGSDQRRKNFWNRMGGKNSSKATDPFSPLYWHKRFGTWANGGEIDMYGDGGYYGYDGEYHTATTPTWSGNTGYEYGGYVPELAYGGMSFTPAKKSKSSKWKKQEGGPMVGDEMDVTPQQLEMLRQMGYEFEMI
jgi:hypothetical protein